MRTDKIVSIFQLEGEQRELAEVIGLDAYKKLVEHYGGSHIYIQKSDTITRTDRNSEIKAKFNGSNYRELAREFNLSEKTIREIVAEIIKEKQNEISEKQLKFF